MICATTAAGPDPLTGRKAGGAGSMGRVRGGSSAHQLATRAERQPVGRPRARGELAKAATRTGPRSWARCQAVATSWAKSTLTCTDAVEHIIVRPGLASRPGAARGEAESKYASMAS